MSGPQHDIHDPEALAEAVQDGHQGDAVPSRLLSISGFFFVALVVVAVVAIYVLQPLMVTSQRAESPPVNPLAATYGRVEPPAPRLQVDPALDIHDHRKIEERALTSYGWVDQQAGVVRIPIARAMELLVERAAPPAGQGAAGAAPGGQP